MVGRQAKMVRLTAALLLAKTVLQPSDVQLPLGLRHYVLQLRSETSANPNNILYVAA